MQPHKKNTKRSMKKKENGSSYYRIGATTTQSQRKHIESMREPKRSGLFTVSIKRLLFLFVFVFIFGNVVYIDGTTQISLDTTLIEGTREDVENIFERRNEAYKSFAEEVVASNILYRNKLTISTSSIETQMLTAFPELKDATVTTSLLRRSLIIAVAPREPRFVLSLSEANADTKINRFVVDTKGVVIDEQVAITVKDDILRIKDEVTSSVQLGERVFSTETIWFIDELERQMDAGTQEVSLVVLPVAANEIHVYLEGIEYFVKFDLSGDVRRQVGSLLATIRDESINITPQQYIDVRVDGRVFVQ